MPVQKPGRSKQDYSTPADFISAVEKRFGLLTYDLAAYDDGSNAKAPKWFGPTQDSLAQDWDALEGRLWLNPPFGNIAPWAMKAAACRRAKVLLLVPASVGSIWFARYVFPFSMTDALLGRLSFDGKAPFPKDCMLCSYGFGCEEEFSIWDWKKDVCAH